MRQRPLPAARGKPPARQFCRWDPGSLSLPPPPLHPFRGPRGPVPDRISGEASLSDACGLSRDDARKHPIHPGSEAAGTHPKPAEAAPLGPGAKACWAVGSPLAKTTGSADREEPWVRFLPHPFSS